MDYPPLLVSGPVDPFPTCWAAVQEPTNPVIAVNGTETTEQYVPATVQLDNGDIWCYVKGLSSIYAYKSTDGGVTFAIQNSGNPVLTAGAGGAWDNTSVLNPAAVYDKANSTLHLYYRGYNSTTGLNGGQQVGHATATVTASVPGAFTKDAANPILTPSNVNADLGGGQTIADLTVSSVIKIGSTFHFYGMLQASGNTGVYSLFHASGSSWNNPSGTSLLLTAPGRYDSVYTTVECPGVCSYRNGYVMIYGQAGNQLTNTNGYLFAAFSKDGVAWDFGGGLVLGFTNYGWQSYQVYTANVLKSNVDPFAAPILDNNGRWHLYYSGFDGTHGQTGLAYLAPS